MEISHRAGPAPHLARGEGEMGEMTWWDRFRVWFGGVGWRVFIWSLPMTEEEYFYNLSERARIEGYKAGFNDSREARFNPPVCP